MRAFSSGASAQQPDFPQMAPRIIRFLIWVALICCGLWIVNSIATVVWYFFVK